MRPDKCGVLISVEAGNTLKVIGDMTPEVENEIEIFAKTNKCIVKYTNKI
jgi:hypothetical protein